MRRAEYAAEQRHVFGVPPPPTLYLHGARDGCQLPEIAARAGAFLSAGSLPRNRRRPARMEKCPVSGRFSMCACDEVLDERELRYSRGSTSAKRGCSTPSTTTVSLNIARGRTQWPRSP